MIEVDDDALSLFGAALRKWNVVAQRPPVSIKANMDGLRRTAMKDIQATENSEHGVLAAECSS